MAEGEERWGGAGGWQETAQRRVPLLRRAESRLWRAERRQRRAESSLKRAERVSGCSATQSQVKRTDTPKTVAIPVLGLREMCWYLHYQHQQGHLSHGYSYNLHSDHRSGAEAAISNKRGGGGRAQSF